MEWLQAFLASALFKAALLGAWGGFVAAFRQDRETFKVWLVERNVEFDWRLAARRWALGAAAGFLSVLVPGGGLGVLL